MTQAKRCVGHVSYRILSFTVVEYTRVVQLPCPQNALISAHRSLGGFLIESGVLTPYAVPYSGGSIHGHEMGYLNQKITSGHSSIFISRPLPWTATSVCGQILP